MKKNKGAYIRTIKDSLDGKITVADAASWFLFKYRL